MAQIFWNYGKNTAFMKTLWTNYIWAMVATI